MEHSIFFILFMMMGFFVSDTQKLRYYKGFLSSDLMQRSKECHHYKIQGFEAGAAKGPLKIVGLNFNIIALINETNLFQKRICCLAGERDDFTFYTRIVMSHTSSITNIFCLEYYLLLPVTNSNFLDGKSPRE